MLARPEVPVELEGGRGGGGGGADESNRMFSSPMLRSSTADTAGM